MKRVIAACLGLMITTAASAAPLGGDIDRLGGSINATSQSLNMQVRVALAGCNTTDVKICRFIRSDRLGFLATTSEEGTTVDWILVMFGGAETTRKDSLEFMSLMAILMAMYAPEAKPEERGVIIEQITEVVQRRGRGTATLHGVKFRTALKEGQPIMVHIERE
jgi:hypothetical protein